MEVDMVFDKGQSCDIAEIKSGQTIMPDFFKNLTFFDKLHKNVENRYIVYGGDQSRIQSGTRIVPWKEAGKIFDVWDTLSGLSKPKNI